MVTLYPYIIIFYSLLLPTYSTVCPPGDYFNNTESYCTKCQPGYYCIGGIDNNANSLPCPAGKYGSSYGLTSSLCNGNCNSGYYCPLGSLSKTEIICPEGHYCTDGTDRPTICPISYYCMQGSSTYHLKCSQGRYGATEGFNNSDCSGACNIGSYCPAGSTSAAQFLCPLGRYGKITGLYVSLCTDICDDGYFCNYGSTSPTQTLCSIGKYCPSGTTAEMDCPAGYFCNIGSSNYSFKCQIGSYCPTATTSQILCPSGTYGDVIGLSDPICSGLCSPGSYCVAGSTSLNSSICPLGKYSNIGSSACQNCLEGHYGNTTGLTSNQCSGRCIGGFYCPDSGLTTSTSYPCPGGFECPSGTISITDVNICMPGNYSLNESSSCFNCQPGYYSPFNQSTFCFQCETGFSSDLGSSYCYLLTLSPQEKFLITKSKTYDILYIALICIISFYSAIFIYCGKYKNDLNSIRQIQWIKYPFAAAIIEKLSLEVMSPEEPEDPILGVSRAFLNVISSIVELIKVNGVNIEDEITLNEDEYEAVAEFASERIKNSVHLFPVRWYICFNIFGLQRYSLEPITLEKVIPDIAKDVANCIKTKSIPNLRNSDSLTTPKMPALTADELKRKEAKREARRAARRDARRKERYAKKIELGLNHKAESFDNN